MPSIKCFKISLDSAELKNGYWKISYCLSEPSPSKIVSVETLEELRAEVNAFAAEYGNPCHANVKCLEARKPAGFDKAFNFSSLFFKGEQK